MFYWIPIQKKEKFETTVDKVIMVFQKNLSPNGNSLDFKDFLKPRIYKNKRIW